MSYVIGLTGGIGSGKTVASDHFATLGVPIIDTDIIAREIVEPGKPALSELANAFGQTILTDNGALDRAALRELAFTNSENKNKLDAITHPAIRVETFLQIQRANYPFCIVVIPLLSDDSAFSELLDRICVVTADHNTKVERVKQRSKLSSDEVERIMQTQLTDEQRLAFADDVIENNGTIKDAQFEVEKLHQLYLDLSAS